ncbi:hypothetical protein P3T43_004342 [Paraburkholderia sp. GAS41]|jgi:hypothetical protein
MRDVKKYWYVFWTECRDMFLDLVQPVIALARWVCGKR